MPKPKDEHSRDWGRKFKTVGTTVGKYTALTLGNMAPGISGSVSSTRMAIREGTAIARQKKSEFKRYYDRVTGGKEVKDAIGDALRDIKNGSFDINKYRMESNDSYDDFDDMIGDYDSEISSASDPDQAALAESKRNTAILGRTIAEGNVGMIKSVSRMTDVLAKTNMKISNINTQKLANITLAGLNQVNTGIAGANARLDAINANLISIMDFQRNNTAILNDRTMEYQQNTENLLKEMGQTISEFRDFMEQQKEITKKKNEYGDTADFSMGFDASQYAQMVKKNFKKSSLGMNLMMGSAALSMMSSMGGMMGGGGSPLEMILPSIFGAFIPKGFKRRVGRLDKAMMQSIDNLLYRIGDLRYSSDSIGSTIGQIFGKERPSISKGPNLANFKKDAMAWNGIAQKSLVEVIPAYLARIEKNTSKDKNAEERFFDMETGKFNTRSNLEEEFRKKMSSTIEWNMQDFTESLNETMRDFRVSDDAKQNIQKSINDAFHDVLLNGGVDYQKKNAQAMRTMYSALSQQGIDSTEIHDLVMQATKSLTETMTELQSTMGSINSATVHLFNDKSRDSSHLLNRRGNIFSGDKFTSSGIRVSDIEDESMRAMYDSIIASGGEYSQRSKIYDDVMGKLFGGKDYEKNPLYKKFLAWSNPATAKQRKRQKLEADKKRYGSIDSLTNRLYDFMNGYDFSDLDNPVSEEPSQPTARQRASSYAVAKKPPHIAGTRNLNRVMQTMGQRNMRNAIESSPKAIEAQGRRTTQAIRSTQSSSGNSRVQSGSAEETLASRMEETETSVKTAVAALNDNFAGPMMNSLAGKDNIFKNLTSKENLQDINKKLFDEKDGIFKGVGSWFKDQMDYIKYTFTGKKYTDRQGNTHDENTNGVVDHLLNGYNFIYTNTMKYLFGNEYGDNETYKKYLKWADFKTKRDEKRQKRLAAEAEQEKTEESANAQQEDIDQRKAERKKRHFHGLGLQPKLKLTDGKSVLTEDDNDKIRRNFIEASEKAAENIQEASKEMTKEVIGDFGENGEGSEVLKKEHAKSSKSFFEKAKKFLPKGIAGALLGGAIGTSVGIHGAGLIGSLFLPSGVVGGAVLGTAGALLASSDTFKSFLFGKKNKDGDGSKESEGFVSKKSQDAFKKALPLIVGAGTIGALKHVMKGAIGAGGAGVASGPTGFFLNSLLPGGPLGAAVLGLGIGLLKNNDRFKSILFGESSDQEDGKGGIMSKPLNALNQIMKKSGHFIKAGGKGALIGAGTGFVASKMGLLGAAIGPAGPIGLGLLGFGLGVASQTEKFKEYMFGQEEFDEDGNSKGRHKTGLLYQVKNLLVTRVFEPISDTLMENVEDFAFWAKKNIMRPFQKAVGPIIDSARSIKKHFTDKINDFFNKLGESVIGSFKSVFNVAFKPMAKVAGAVGQAATKGVFGALKFSLAPLTGSLKVLEIATGHLRKKMMKEENRSVFEHFGDIIGGIVNTTRDQWANDNRDYSGPLGGLNKILTRGRDIFTNTRQGFDTARAAYRKGQGIEGGNTFDWRNFREHAKFDKKQKKRILADRKTWKNVNEIRADLANANRFGEINLSQKGLEEVRSKLVKAGFTKEIASRYVQNNEHLNELVYNREKFKDRLRGKGDGEPVVRDSSATQDYYERTKYYQNYIMDRFDTITKVFVRLGVQDALKNKQKVDFEDLKRIDKDLKDNKMSWDELHINPADMLNINSLSQKDFDEYMASRFEGPDAHPEDESTGFTKFLKGLLDRQNATEKTNEAIKENFEKLNETSEANLRMNISSQAFASGASESDVEAAAGVNVPSGTFKLAADSAKAKERAEKKAAEQKESEEIKAANSSSQDEDEEKTKETVEKEAEEESKKKGGTVFDSIKGFAGKAFSFAGNLFGDSKLWKAVGISAVVGGLFAKEISGFAKKIYEFAKPAIDVVVEKVPQVISTAATWIGENAPRLISSLVDRVCENMGFIVENGFKIIWSAVSTIGMKLANKAAKLAHVPVPFPSVEKDEKTTYTFNQETGEFEEHTELNSDVIVDEEGNKSYVTRGEHGIKNSLLHLAFHAVRGTKGFKLGAKATGKALKYGGKAIGWVTGVIPGLKIGSGIIKGSVVAGKGIVKGGKAIYNAVKGKGASAVAGEAVEAAGDKAVKEAVEAAAETAVKDTAEVAATKKGIKKLLDKVAEKVATASNAVKRFFSIDKLEVAVRELIDLAAKKLESSDHKLIHKIGEHITNKTAEAAGRTAADASIVVGAGLAIFDAVNGLLDAAYLFGVDEANTTPRMRLVSSAMSALLGTGFGSWLDILLEVIYMLTGKNGKKTFAHFLYKALGGDNEKLLEGIAVMEAETERYNKENGTHITSAEYNELKNSNKSITGRIMQAGSWLWSRTLGSKEAYDKKYEDYSKYKASEEEIARYKQQLKAQEAREDGVPVSDYNSGDINKAPSGVSSQEAQYYAMNAEYGADYDYSDGNIGMGAGPRRLSRRAITYGSGLNQADPRWANLSLGRFPNGTESTMATGGCGPTALSMAAKAVGYGSPTDPSSVAIYAKNHGYIQDGGATAGLFTSGAAEMGMKATSIDKASLKNALSSNNPVILSGRGKGNTPYTEAGHVIEVDGLDRNGKAIVNDPMRGTSTMDISKLKNGMTHGWSYTKSIGFGSGDADSTKKNSIISAIESMGDMLIGAADYVKDWIQTTAFKKCVQSIVKNLIKLIQRASSEVIQKVEREIFFKTGVSVTKTAVQPLFSIYDAINGFMDTPRLFGVDEEDVTPLMRTVSTIMQVLLGINVASTVISTLLDAYEIITGNDAKQWFARFVYEHIGGDSDQLKDAIKKMEMQTDKYNLINGTKITPSDFNQLKNGDKSLDGKIVRALSWLYTKASFWNSEDDEKYKKRYEDYSKYDVTGYGTGAASPFANNLQKNLAERDASNIVLTSDGLVKQMETAAKSTTTSPKENANSTTATQSTTKPSTGKLTESELSELSVATGIPKADLREQQEVWGANLRVQYNEYLNPGSTDVSADVAPTAKIKPNRFNTKPLFADKLTSLKIKKQVLRTEIAGKGLDRNALRRATGLEALDRKAVQQGLDSGALARRYAVTKAKNEAESKSRLERFMEVGTLKTTDALEKCIQRGYLKDGEEYKFNTFAFYTGMKVADIASLAIYKPELLSDERIPKFRVVYLKFVKSGKYKASNALDINLIKTMFGDTTFIMSLGGNGQEGQYEYKYGFPFFQTDDPRWDTLKWRGETVKSRGGDLASLAMVATALGPNFLTPDYIYNNWLNTNPDWKTDDGLDMDKVFTDGGYNAMTGSQVDGKRVKLAKLTSPSSIIAALKQKKPVVMTGYRYAGSIFGGHYAQKDAPTSGRDDYSTLVARASDGNEIAVLDPFTTLDQSGSFLASKLSDKVGTGQRDVIKNAYSIANPDGSGVDKVDLKSKKGGTSDYQSIADAKGLGKLSALFSNFAAIGSHILDSLLGGTEYRSITSVNPIEDDVPDEYGVGTTVTTDENGNIVASESQAKSNVAAATKPMADAIVKIGMNASRNIVEYFRYKNMYYGRRKTAGNRYTYFKIGLREPKNMPGYKMIGVPAGFNLALMSGKNGASATSTTSKASATGSLSEDELAALSVATGIPKADLRKQQEQGGADLRAQYNEYVKPEKVGGAFKNLIFYGPAAPNPGDPTTNATFAWQYLRGKGVPAIGTAGLLGNIEKESNFMFNTGETLITKKLGTTDEKYTADIDSGAISRERFLNPLPGKQYGYGLVQWTSPGRKAGLYDLAKSRNVSIADPMTQMDTLWNELNGPYKKTLSVMNSSNNLRDVSTYVLKHFEVPASRNSTKTQNARYDASNKWYNKLKNVPGDPNISSASIGAASGYVADGTDAAAQGNAPSANAEKMAAIANAYIASMMGEDYETAKAEYLSGGGSATTTDYTTSDPYATTTDQTNIAQANAAVISATTSALNARRTANTATNPASVFTSVNGKRTKSIYGPGPIGYGGDTWLNICVKVKQAIAALHKGYSQSGYNKITVNGETRTIRRDCSGYVSACISYYTGKHYLTTSHTYAKRTNSTLTKAGFTSFAWPGWKSLQVGDIIARNGHVEIFAGLDNGRHMVWNCGSDKSVNNPGKTQSGHSSYTTVWRPANPGAISIANMNQLTINEQNQMAAMGQQQTARMNPAEKAINDVVLSMSNSLTKLTGGQPIAFGRGPDKWFADTLHGEVTSEYGTRSSSLGNEFHRGLDIAAEKGQNVLSPIDGVVVSGGSDPEGYGNYSVIRDSRGNNHIFAHMDSVGYGIGDQVSKNDVIGQVGSTGRSTGDHLHYEIRKNGSRYSTIDPKKYNYASLNIHDMNMRKSDDDMPIGGGTSNEVIAQTKEKLDVAINTKNIEDKMDRMIEAMQLMVENTSRPQVAAGNVTNNTVNNTVYGRGSDNKPVVKRTSKTITDTGETKQLARIHKQIASRK